MVNAIMSREFGFGFELSLQDLTAINLCKEGNQYADEQSTMSLFGNANKKHLPKSPFICTLEIGIRNDGYWVYKYMAVQLEDCADCL
jgi:hypothetical protein